MRRKSQHVYQMDASSPGTLHSPRCWLASHLHTASWAGLGFSTLFIFSHTFKKGEETTSESLQLPEALEKERAEEQAGSLPSSQLKVPDSLRYLCLSSSPHPETIVIELA